MEQLLHFWAVPFLTLVVALIPLASKVFDKHPIVKSAIVVIALTLLFVIQPVQSMRDAKDQNQREADVNDKLRNAETTIAALERGVHTVDTHQQAGFASLEQSLQLLIERGLSPSIIETLRDSSRAAADLRPYGSSPTAQSSHIKITYYPKAVDGDKVFANLRKLGYHVSEGASEVKDEPTNALWAGADVPLRDVKAIGLTLRQAGVNFRSVQRFCQATGSKAFLVEIGAKEGDNSPILDATYLNQLPELPVDQDCGQTPVKSAN
jgi:hypothetical protein